MTIAKKIIAFIVSVILVKWKIWYGDRENAITFYP